MSVITKVINYKDNPVYINEIEFNSSTRLRPCICPVCQKKIKSGKNISLMNNFKFFPNVILHENCFNKANKENLFEKIERDYKEYKRLERIFGN